MTKALKEINARNGEVAKVEVVQKNSRNCWIGFTLYHGSFKDLFAILKVAKLEPLSMQRYRIGGLTADSLTPGSWKQLNNVEIAQMLGTTTEGASFFFK